MPLTLVPRPWPINSGNHRNPNESRAKTKERNMKKIFLAFIFMTCDAMAVDNFSGVYAGIRLGYVNADNSGKEINNAATGSGWALINNPEGIAYGLDVGFNRVLYNNILAGIEGSVEKTNAEDERGGHFPYPSIYNGSWPMKTEFIYGYAVKARVGYIFNGGATLFYGTGGMAGADIKSTLYAGVGASLPTLPGMVENQQSNNKTGWLTGVGLEHSFLNHFSVKLEYQHADYGTLNIAANPYSGPGNDTYERQQITADSIYSGVSYRF
jgi:opacity protein-like surface antigen